MQMERKGKQLDCFFSPSSVAVIGASPKHPVTSVILRNFISGKYSGKIYPVNPKYEEIFGLKCYKSILEIPDQVDLAVIAIPAPAVPKVVEECGKKGVKGAVVISGGFKEIGPEGAERERKLVEAAKKYNMRIIGPNCIGVLDTVTGVDTFFLPPERMKRPKPGGMAFISQSGAFAAAICDWAASEGIGLGKCISYGNKSDVDDSDLLEYLSEQPDVKVIAAYIEGVDPGEGPEFMKAIKNASKKKPVLVVKAGKTKRGTAAVASHTGSLAGSYTIYKYAIKQSGGIEVPNFEEMFDAVKAFLTQPLPKGNKVLIVTNGGGCGVMTVDAAESLGLVVPEVPEELQRKLRETGHFPPHTILHNPIDVTGDTDALRYKLALDVVLPTDVVDAAIVDLLFQTPNLGLEVVDYIAECAQRYNKPILVAYVGGEFALKGIKRLEEKGVPCYPSPERAVKALYYLVKYSEWLEKQEKVGE